MSKRKVKKKFPRQPQHISPRPVQPAQPTVEPEPPPSVNLGFYNASVVATRPFDSVQVIIAGAGGNGSYMTMHMGRLAYALDRAGKVVNLTVCDPQMVEEKNIGRQLFCYAELGVPKAEAVARRYGQAWGLNALAYVGEYSENLLIGADLTLLVGCADNAAARRTLADTLQHNPVQPEAPDALPSIFWLDLGNHRRSGRVLLGTAPAVEQMRGAFLGRKRCISIPSPTLLYPSLLIPEPEEIEGNDLSCAELTARGLQSFNINARIAAEAAEFATSLLLTRDLKCYGWEVNLAAHSSKPYYLTPEEVADSIDKPVSYVQAEECMAMAS